jgi:hypothetical protein
MVISINDPFAYRDDVSAAADATVIYYFTATTAALSIINGNIADFV